VESTLRITEIFYSIQGEASTSGLPTVFVRLTGCPLRCTYCDTEYAFHGGEKMQIAQIVEKINAFNCPLVCITGGEPLAQPNVNTLMDVLCEQGYQVSLETSGAIDVSKVNPSVTKVIDIKTPSSNESSKNKVENFLYLNEKDICKFVVGNEDDFDWAKRFIKEHLSNNSNIYFSPVTPGMDPKALAELILRDGLTVRLQLQLHKYLWGDERGR
jgi:7-carboxy-7-deazaguanine synthase